MILDAPGTTTLEGIVEAMRHADVVYLICHGVLKKNKPFLYLEDSSGSVSVTDGSALIEAVRGMQERPRLIVLGSCESGGTTGIVSYGNYLGALAPSLVEAGVPAVLGMQGRISIEANRAFMTTFFREVMQDGRIERAVSVARQDLKTKNLTEWWIPVLYSGVHHGVLWFSSAGPDKFPRLGLVAQKIREDACTPIVGPGISNGLFGSPQEIASKLADKYNLPMSMNERQALPQVCQQLKVREGELVPQEEFILSIKEYLLQKARTLGIPVDNQTPFEVIFRNISNSPNIREFTRAHQLLASLPVPAYVSTSPDGLLLDCSR